MSKKRNLTDAEKAEAREKRRSAELAAHPGAKITIHVADETDDNGE